MYITALDIGSAQIKALVAEIKKDGKIFILDAIKIPSFGIRKGEIADIAEATSAINEALVQIKNLNKLALRNIYVNIGSTNVKAQNSRGIVAIARADGEVSFDDIERVGKAAQAIKLLPNRMILHSIVREYILDGIGDIRDPLGMNGTRLEVNSLIIDVFSPAVKDIVKTIESCGGTISGLVYDPLAAGRVILSKNQKDLGVVLIDIGGGTTSTCVYEEGKLLHASTFPIGSASITNDLAIGLKCSIRAAELIKIFFGNAKVSGNLSKEKITPEIFKSKTGFDLKEVDKNFKSNIPLKFVEEIIESRLAEIFEFVQDELRLISRAHQLPSGAVICGNGAKIPGIIELAKAELRLPVEFGISNLSDFEFLDSNFEKKIEDADFAVSLGLLSWANDKLFDSGSWQNYSKYSFKNILRYFMP